jgi:voltage-gated potassium channel
MIRRLRQKTSNLFDQSLPSTPASQAVVGFIAVLIVVNVATIILETVESIRAAYAPVLNGIERGATAVFTLEYVLRIWSSVDRTGGRYRDPVLGRLRYAVRPVSLIDLIAILPAILGLFGSYDLRLLRLVRLLRMLKLTRYSSTLSLLWAVLRDEARALFAVLFLLSLMVVISSSVMYILENDAQPRAFGSIPAAMWWAVETITTVGYGDVVPKTPAGKMFGGVVAILGIGMVALFSGVLTVSFMEQLRQRRQRYRRLVETGLQGGRLNMAGVAEMERLGTDLGVGETTAREIMDEAIIHAALPHFCPHCGHDLGTGGVGAEQAPVSP